tara:strand:- start:120 stop:431 length:312 start_codon:yes stop_codon:yes gene_type:complete
MNLKYKLLKDLPCLKKGAIFEHRVYDKNFPDRGNYGCGVLILAWINGMCQEQWCGETFIFPGQLADNKDWFVLVREKTLKKELAQRINDLENEIDEIKTFLVL